MPRCLVLAEIGSCHDGSLDKAYRLIEASRECGADIVKAQYWSSSEKLAERRNAAEYLPIYRRYQMPRDWLDKLKVRCESVGIEFACTTYLQEDIAIVDPYVKRFKVASFESEDIEFVQAHRAFKKPVIVSCGMGGPYGYETEGDWTYLICTSAYPCPIDQLGLERLRQKAFYNSQFTWGFSDHSTSTLTGAVAVAAGARVIEKHVRHGKTDKNNPDYAHSIPVDRSYAGSFPIEWTVTFEDYVDNIREAEKAMRMPEKKILPSEEKMREYKVRQ